ncbi:hypothetical protein [Rossellomorea marisflavi]|uniref:hypothetical protein n=1 Tax=Rossellomorea marisflavi TaxID=189381 RepID=UPI003FA195F5
MSYDYYFYKVKQSTAEDLAKGTYEELLETYGDDDFLFLNQFPFEELHSNGDLTVDEIESITEGGVSLFIDASMKNKELDVIRVGKDGLKALIEAYRKRVIRQFRQLLGEERDSLGRTTRELQEDTARAQLYEWENNPPYDFSTRNGVSGSLRYEYVIFELVYQYKTLTDEDEVLFCGH